MDPAFDLAPTPDPLFTARRLAIALGAIFALTIGGLWMFEAVERTAAGELIWPVSTNVWTGVVFVTAFVIVLTILQMMTARADPDRVALPSRDGNPVLGLIAGWIALLIAVSAAARLGVQLVGFAGLHPVAFPVTFTVVDTSHRQSRGGSDYYLLRLRYGDRGRTFSDEVGRAVYDAAREGDTVALPVQTGRFGVQRALVATRIAPSDLHHPA